MNASEVDTDALYPEHAKLDAVKALSQPLGEFLDWLKSSGREIGHWTGKGNSRQRDRVVNVETGEKVYEDVYEERFEPYPRPVNDWLADFFEIDLQKLYDEKDAMYQGLRETDG